MAVNRITIDGYGQLELNQVAFPRTGRIEAQCGLDATDFASIPAENGMILRVDKVAGKIKLPTGTNDTLLALNYTAEHMYDERANGLKDFKTVLADDFYPRLGYLSVGDRFTTNCVSYDTADFATEAALKTALTSATLKTTPVYAKPSKTGAIQITKTAPTEGLVLQVVKGTTMPDGQYAVKFIVLSV